MSNLFSDLFESFNTLTLDDALKSKLSPYTIAAPDNLAIAADTISEKSITSKIVEAYSKCNSSILDAQHRDAQGFKDMCFRITQRLSMSGILKGDPKVVQPKLAAMLALAYISGAETYEMFPFDKAKNKAIAAFALAKNKLGLNFFDTVVEDELKKVIFEVLWKRPKDEPKNDAPTQAPLQQPKPVKPPKPPR